MVTSERGRKMLSKRFWNELIIPSPCTHCKFDESAEEVKQHISASTLVRKKVPCTK
jgi:hypothetical protein